MRSLRIGIIVGEPSGDLLAASLVNEIRKKYSFVQVEGIIGDKLLSLGCCKMLYHMNEICMMGLVEPIKHLPKLLKMQRWLVDYFTNEPPDLFIGVDAPDFNLRIEKKLKSSGIPVVHYVSPSVWAWRRGRIKLIKQAVDLMLTLLPFEEEFYKNENVLAKYVGHPAADKINLNYDNLEIRKELGLKKDDFVLGVFPGSRNSEIKAMSSLYFEVISNILKIKKNIKIVIPVINEDHKNYLKNLNKELNLNLDVIYVINDSYKVMQAMDIGLVTSGTATLEVMLHIKPMVVAYKTSFLTYQIAKRLVTVKYVALPNLLHNKMIADEFIQNDANVENLEKSLLKLIDSKTEQEKQTKEYIKMHKVLKQNSDKIILSEIEKILDLSDCE